MEINHFYYLKGKERKKKRYDTEDEFIILSDKDFKSNCSLNFLSKLKKKKNI